MRYAGVSSQSRPTPVPEQPIRSTLLRALPLLAVLSACDVTGSGDPLTISGTVTRSGTGEPVANATVRLLSHPLTGGGYLIGVVQTDAQGQYTLRVDEQRSYARPNCAAMDLFVSAAGYADTSPPTLGTQDDPTCESGVATVNVALTPLS